MKRSSGVSKRCGHKKTCNCEWQFHYKAPDVKALQADGTLTTIEGVRYRFSLDHYAGQHYDNKSDAEDAAKAIKRAIADGTFGTVSPVSQMTLSTLCDNYFTRSVKVKHPKTAHDYQGGLAVICSTMLKHPSGPTLRFGDWRLTDISADVLARYGEARHAAGCGAGGTNRSYARLRACFNWGILIGLCDTTPFRRHGVSTCRREKEEPRSRRLNGDTDEEGALLRACGPHLRSVVEGLLATGCRSGELLDLQWSQVVGLTIDMKKTPPTFTWAARSAISLLAEQTKTRQARSVPVNARLRAILEMRAMDPAGRPFAGDRYVFGNGIGEKVEHVTRAWNAAVLRSHGVVAHYTPKGGFSAACRKALARINLHMHDLRRECGSRWLENGVPMNTVRDWLGHANISMTSTYLSTTMKGQHTAMTAYDAACHSRVIREANNGVQPPATTDGGHEMLNENGVGPQQRIMQS